MIGLSLGDRGELGFGWRKFVNGLFKVIKRNDHSHASPASTPIG